MSLRGPAAPVVSLLVVVATAGAALRNGPEVTHGFPRADARPPLRVVIEDSRSRNAHDRLLASKFLGFYRSEAAFAALLERVKDPDPLVRLAALRGLMMRNDGRAIPVLEEMMRADREELVRHRAEIYLGYLRSPLGMSG